MRSVLWITLVLVVVALITIGCHSPDNSNANSSTPPSAVEAMVGTWRPRGLPLKASKTAGSLAKAEYQFKADKTYVYDAETSWPPGEHVDDEFRRPTHAEGFFEVDGRKLTLEIPQTIGGQTSYMLSADGQSFTTNVAIGYEFYSVTFHKQPN